MITTKSLVFIPDQTINLLTQFTSTHDPSLSRQHTHSSCSPFTLGPPIQLRPLGKLQLDLKGKEESICVENWNERDFH